jgi:hypothetical protein
MKNYLASLFLLLANSLLSLLSAQVTFTSSNLPIIVIGTNGQIIPDEGKINVNMGVIYDENGGRNYYAGTCNHFNGTVGIEVRGSSSQGFPKKSYGIEIRDSLGQDMDFPLLGFPEESDWVLYAPYTDKTMLRDVLTMYFSRKMGWYASRTKFCELVLNDEYMGVYVLMEKIKRDGSRVNIKKMDADDLDGDSVTGGYIVKIDKFTGGATGSWTSTFPPYPGAWQSVKYQYHYPAVEDIQPLQKTYIQDYVYQFENSLYNNPFGQNTYLNYIDDNSFIDFLIVNEIGKNVDGYRLSTFLYKDRESEGGKLSMGPIWDFNLAFGNADYYDGWITTGWQYSWTSGGDSYPNPFWWSSLMAKSAFQTKLKQRWNELRQTVLHSDSINSYINNQVAWLIESQERNYQRWPIMGQYVWPNWYIGQTYTDEINYLKSWFNNRIAWMDGQLQQPPIINEINYHSSTSLDADDWVEIYNPNVSAFNISNYRLKDANNNPYFTFPNGTIIPAGSYLVVCRNVTKFHNVFPAVTTYIGNLPFDLSNTGEPVRLTNQNNNLTDYVYYGIIAPWPNQASGTGKTIELKNPQLDNQVGANWQTSGAMGGTPGSPNSPVAKPDIFINEFMADNAGIIPDPQGDADDWLEIYNGTEEPFDVGGLYITDDFNIPDKYLIPDNKPDSTTIAPGGFLVLWADSDLGDGILHIGFKLSKSGEQIGLFDETGLLVIDTVTFGNQFTNKSMGRVTDGYPAWQYFQNPTAGFSNTSVQLVPIPAGWSGISSYRNPFNPDVEEIFEDNLDELIFLGDGTNVFMPAQGINTIGDWNPYSGYFLKTSEPFTTNITGLPVTNRTLTLQPGWNLIPVLSSCEISCAEIFAQAGSAFEAATDVAGYRVYWPLYGIQTLEVLLPGKSYLVKVNQETTITFSGCP